MLVVVVVGALFCRCDLCCCYHVTPQDNNDVYKLSEENRRASPVEVSITLWSS